MHIVAGVRRAGKTVLCESLEEVEYFDTPVIATGSSTLEATAKFRDTLTGRKETVWLTPMIVTDLVDFGHEDLRHRLLHGGLPPFFLSSEVPERDFQDWIDAYWAKDIQELFRHETPAPFRPSGAYTPTAPARRERRGARPTELVSERSERVPADGHPASPPPT